MKSNIEKIIIEVLEKYFGKMNDLHKQTLDVYELSKYINLSPSYIRKLVSQGKYLGANLRVKDYILIN